MSKEGNIYSEQIKLGAYYTYDEDHNKVYDIQSMRRRFKELVTKLKDNR